MSSIDPVEEPGDLKQILFTTELTESTEDMGASRRIALEPREARARSRETEGCKQG